MQLIHPRLPNWYKDIFSKGACEDCDYEIPKHEISYRYKGNLICKDCSNDRYSICAVCDSILLKDDTYSYEYDIYCHDCFYNEHDFCNFCHNPYLNECFKEHYKRCDKCKEYTCLDEMTKEHGEQYCSHCEAEPRFKNAHPRLIKK